MKSLVKTMLLLLAATLPLVGSAQLKRSVKNLPEMIQNERRHFPEFQTMEMPAASPAQFLGKAPQRDGAVKAYYRRPAGGFTGIVAVVDGCCAYYNAPFVFLRPKAEYTFVGTPEGLVDGVDYEYQWSYQKVSTLGDIYTKRWYKAVGKDLTVSYGVEIDSVPIFTVKYGGDSCSWFMRGHQMGDPNEPLTIVNIYSAHVAAVYNVVDSLEFDVLKSSRTFCCGGRDGDRNNIYVSFIGLDPYGRNDVGYWFGKNNGTLTDDDVQVTYRVDGIGQAFEKPEHPYRLNKVYMLTSVLDVVWGAGVDMTCRVYKLDKMSEYGEPNLPEEPGELIARGVARVKRSTFEDTGGLVAFDLEYIDPFTGLAIGAKPLINFPILIVVDGYNDPEMAELRNFSAMCANDFELDEGFGELAYIKRGINDEEGNFTGEYEWVGLFNMFGVKTGLTIFMSTDFPYSCVTLDQRDVRIKAGQQIALTASTYPDGLSCEVASSDPTVAQVSMDGNKIQVTGISEGTATIAINTPHATSEPYYCYVTVYSVLSGDVDMDGKIGVGDVSALIDILLGDSSYSLDNADYNGDGNVDISDLVDLIDYLLSSPR